METIAFSLIAVDAFALLLIGYLIRVLFEKRQLKVVKEALDHTLETVSAKDAELAQAHSVLDELNEKLSVHDNILTALVEASAHGMLTVDSHNCIHLFNKRFCDMWDLPEENIHGGVRVYTILQHCMKKTTEPEMFLLNHHKINHSRDGLWSAEIRLSDKKIFQSSSSPIRGIDGTYYGRIWEFVDVTERVQQERRLSEAYSTIQVQYQELANSEETLRHQYSILNTTQTELIHQKEILCILKERLAGGLCIFDENRNLSDFNQKFLDIWDTSREELERNLSLEPILQTRAFALHSDADAQAALLDEISYDRTRSLHDEIVLVNGTILERYSTPLIDEKGVYHGRLWEFIDITKHVQREQELARAYTALRAFKEHLAGGLCSFDEKRNISGFNQKFLDIWDTLREELEQNLSLESVLQTRAFARHCDADVQTAHINEISHD